MQNDLHRGAILLFSAGKDSLACLLLLRDYWDRINVVWARPGEVHPDVDAYMQRVRDRVPHFTQIDGNSRAWIEQNGWPSDVVPVRWTNAPHGAEPTAIRFMPYTACCMANMWGPLSDYMQRANVGMVITGQKSSDALRNRMRDAEVCDVDGRRFWNPLQDWTDDDVFAFLRAQNEPLPPGYDDGGISSQDCWYCTAYLDHNAPKLRRMRQQEPDRWEVVFPVLDTLAKAIAQTHADVTEIIKE